MRISQTFGFTLEEIRGFLISEGQCDQARVLAQIALRTEAALAERAALDVQLDHLAQLRAMLEHGHAIPACADAAAR